MSNTYINAEQAIELADTVAAVLRGDWFDARQFGNVIQIRGADGTIYELAVSVTDKRACDYCPNTVFAGKVCPTCQYDYTNVTD